MAALNVARQAIADAGWTEADLKDAAIVVGTSRGNAAGWLGPWPGRRPFKLMAASNTIHSEPASAITIEFGITGPNYVLASGCSAGLDAIGIAMMLLQSGAVGHRSRYHLMRRGLLFKRSLIQLCYPVYSTIRGHRFIY